MRLEDLQPADFPRRESVDYFASLTRAELKSVGLPQVWNYKGSNFVSDGNFRSFFRALSGKGYIEVEYCDNLSELGVGCFREEFRRMKKLKDMGIYSFLDILSQDTNLVF